MVAALAGIVIFALGGTALATTGKNGPTVPALGDPVSSSSEIQVVALPSGTTGGTFTLTLSGVTTAAIAYNAAAADVKTATTTAGFSPAVSSVSGNAGGPYKFAWASSAGDVPTMTGSGASLTPAGTITFTVWSDGNATIAGQVAPHSGYSSTTDYCLQCHKVHFAPDPGYALLANSSVTSTCKTCHALFGGSATGAINPGFPGTEGTASLRSAYDLTSPTADHAVGSSTVPYSTLATITDANWVYGGFGADVNGASTKWTTADAAGAGTASDLGGGLYCGSCHTPHGDFGQVINSRYFRTTANSASLTSVQVWQNDAAYMSGTTVKYLHQGTDGVWEGCTATGGGGTCADLTATDSEGQTVYLYGYKLLSAYPNHSWTQGPESWGLDSYSHDQARWCGRCHDKALPSLFGGTFHSHPTGCTACHGNPSDNTSFDFPHTSTFSKFLKSYPDALCISCHTSGSLP